MAAGIVQKTYRIFVIDDDASIVDVVCRFLNASESFDCRCFTSPKEFLEACSPNSVDCVVADLKMPEMDGVELHEILTRQEPFLSFVFLTGHANVPTAVRLMERGAFTVLEKPFQAEQLVSAVQRGAKRTVKLRSLYSADSVAAERLSSLTDEEQEVLDCMISGLTNRESATKLELSSRTLDRRRQSILHKMKAESIAELVATVTRLRNRSIQ